MDRDAGGTCYVLSGGMRGKADDSSVFAWLSFTFCWLDTSELAASFAATGTDCAAA